MLFGHRGLLLTNVGRRTGRPRQTVLEVVEYRKAGPEVVVANRFDLNSDWTRNIEASPGEKVTVGFQHFVALIGSSVKKKQQGSLKVTSIEIVFVEPREG